MKNIYKIIIGLGILIPTVVFGAKGGAITTEKNLGVISPTGINQGNGFINPIRIGDRIEAAYFIASSTTATSTFVNTTVSNRLFVATTTDTLWGGRHPIFNAAGTVTIGGNLTVGSQPPTYADDNLSIADFTSNVDNYSFLGIQNKSTGINASSDLVFGNALTTASDYYFDCGIAGSNNNTAIYPGLGPAHWGYCFTSDAGLSMGIATTTLGADFRWVTGADSLLNSDIKMVLTNAGRLGIGTTSPYAKLSVVGDSGVVAEKFTATSTTAISSFGGSVGIGTTSPTNKLEVSNGNIFVSSPNGQGRGLTLSTDVMDDTSRPNIRFLRNSFAAFLGDDHASQLYSFLTTLSSTRVFGATIRTYGPETGGFANYTSITHDGSDGILATNSGDLVLSPVSLKVGIGTSSPATELNVAGTLPEITLSDTDASTNLKHWFLEADSGAFAIGTTSDQLVKTTTRPFNISSNGQISIGNKDSTTARLVVTGGSAGTSLITLSRPSVAQFSFALAGGGLAFSDDTAVFNVANLFGDSQQNQLYIGTKNLPTADGRTDILSGTSFSASAGTDVNGHPLEIIAGRGTGAGTPGDLKFSTGIAGSSGTTAQSTSTRMFISGSTGNVGIGTTSPTISGTSLSNFIIGSAAATNAGMALDGSSTGTGLRYGFASNGTLAAGILRNNNAGTLTISNSSANATDIVIGSTGNVGVASSSPSALFTIGASGTATSTSYKASGTGKGHCEVWADSDGVGVTYVSANNGVLTASTVSCR